MRTCLLSLWGDSLTYTIANALAFGGHEVIVWIADVTRDQQSVWSLSKRIESIPGVTLIASTNESPPSRIDRLIVQGHPLLVRHTTILEKLAPQSEQLTLVSSGDRSRGYRRALKLQWREWRWCNTWFRKVKRIAYKDGYYPIDLFGMARSRRVVGFDVHSKFLRDEDLFQAIHSMDWKEDAARSYRVNFVGSRDPKIREKVLEMVHPYFKQPAQTSSCQDRSNSMYWHVFSDANPAALSPDQFLGVITDSDFTLAPPGYSHVTHRPVEALLRGSIPVLNACEMNLYDLGLANGVNCIAVKKGRWDAAMERIGGMSEAEIIGMRRNIQSMLIDKVAYPALSRGIRERLGFSGQRALGEY